MISIILPVYNGEKWLKKAIQSVIDQSEKNWELIVVDDESHDSSLEIAKSAETEDPRIRVISIGHLGPGGARNRGLDIARGDFIMFLDADDMLHPYAIEVLKEVQLESNGDVVEGKTLSGVSYQLSGLENRISKTNNLKTYGPIEAIENVLYQRDLTCSVWSKLYKSKLFENVRFNEGILYEDLDIFYRLFEKANKIVKIETPVYFYRKNPKSILRTWTPQRLSVLDVTRRIEGYMREIHPELVASARERRYSANFNMLLLSLRNCDKSRVKECRAYIKSHRLSSLKNRKARLKNRLASLLLWF